MNEIHDSTTRISTLVGAAKQYSQMDRAPFQTVDVHELLDSTLTMLSGKIGAASRWSRNTTARLPEIPAYAAELNQVWTNLIDNAVDAMDGAGHADRSDLGGERRAAGGDLRHRSRNPEGASRAGSSSSSSPPNPSARAPVSAWTSPGGSW